MRVTTNKYKYTLYIFVFDHVYFFVLWRTHSYLLTVAIFVDVLVSYNWRWKLFNGNSNCSYCSAAWRHNTALNSCNSYSSSLIRPHAWCLLIDGLLKRFFILKYDLVWTSSIKNARSRDYRDKNKTKHFRIEKNNKEWEIKIKQE